MRFPIGPALLSPAHPASTAFPGALAVGDIENLCLGHPVGAKVPKIPPQFAPGDRNARGVARSLTSLRGRLAWLTSWFFRFTPEAKRESG